MSTLIIGGTGTIGSWVVRELIENGSEPVVFDLVPDMSLLRDIENKVRIVRGDILDVTSLSEVVRKHDVKKIIHMAAYLAENNPYASFRVNCEGMFNVLEVSRLFDIQRLVYCSAFPAGMGPLKGEFAHPQYKPVNEDYVGTPELLYGATKLFGEHLGLVYNRKFGLDFIVLRLASQYGPGRIAKFGPVTAVVDVIVANAMAGVPTSVPRGGDAVQDWTYNKDSAHGISLALDSSRLTHRIFNIGTGRGENLHDVVEIVKESFPKVVVDLGPGADLYNWGTPSGFVLDISRARSELGFQPRFDLRSGINDYVRTLRQLGSHA